MSPTISISQGESLNENTTEPPERKNVLLFSRHGESQFNVLGRIGGNSNLSPRGQAYSLAISNYANSLGLEKLTVMTSKKKRTIATAAKIKCSQRIIREELDELNAGVCEGLTYEEIEEQYPEDYELRDLNKLAFCYKGGESYAQVMERVNKVCKEIKESDNNLLIISHQATLRCLLGQLLLVKDAEIPYLQIPLHTVMRLEESQGKWKLNYIRFPIPSVNTYREKPETTRGK